MKMIKALIYIMFTVLLSACGPDTLKTGAENVIITNDPPDKSCKFIKQIHGHQGNAITAHFTSNPNIQLGSLNMVRNEAVKCGANYVELINANQSWHTIHGSGGEVGMQFIGNAFRCSPQEIGLA